VTALGDILAARIAAEGPLRLDAFMALCQQRYYATRDPLGPAGDFVTAPEISQMFGELIGAWAAQVWADQGLGSFVLAELGPGRGTLMRDALRAAAVLPGFREAARLWLVETSPALRARQAVTLAGHAPRWADGVHELPPGPLIAIANEFFDALPIRQFQRVDPLWRERHVALAAGRLVLGWGPPRPDAGLDARFLVPDGTVVDLCPAGEAIATALGARVRDGGAALIVDYGAWDGTGDTLQAVRGHARADPLDAPGEADLTAHVRFRALAEAARVRAHFTTQGAFLELLGIAVRAQTLARRDPEAVAAAHRRLTHPDEMGNLFRVLALTPGHAVPPGFAP
jgi:SAM-dependent MidA family methyltransferase